MKKVIVTGSAGFIGSHFVDHVLKNTDWEIIGLDSFRHRGDSVRVQKDPRYKIITCDLRQPISPRIKELWDADYIINFAAESHVDRSIDDPRSFIENNTSLACSVMGLARVCNIKKIIQISTDEVYGAAIEGTLHKEWSPILPSNPYAASKACQEAVAISYWRTYGVPLIIVNGMNMFGEKQDPEKYIPGTIRKVAKGETVMIHGTRDYVGKRHYIHARNFADGLLFLLKEKVPTQYEDQIDKIVFPDRFNVVGEVEMDNLELARTIASIMGKDLTFEFVDFHKARPGHDRRYALDGTKLKELGWKQPLTFKESIERTVAWFLENQEWIK